MQFINFNFLSAMRLIEEFTEKRCRVVAAMSHLLFWLRHFFLIGKSCPQGAFLRFSGWHCCILISKLSWKRMRKDILSQKLQVVWTADPTTECRIAAVSIVIIFLRLINKATNVAQILFRQTTQAPKQRFISSAGRRRTVFVSLFVITDAFFYPPSHSSDQAYLVLNSSSR